MASGHDKFHLGDWVVDPALCELSSRNGERVPVQPKVMDVLLCLVDADGRVVSRQKLVETVWEGRPTSDEPINRCIAELRAALGDDRSNPRYIRTVPKRGYQLLTAAIPVGEADAAESASGSPLTGWIIYLALIAAFLAGWWWWGFGQDEQHAEPPRILVLPLSPLSEGSELLADALTEEILNSLAQSPDLLVYSRTTTFSVPDQAGSPMEQARKLSADLVLEGSVRLTDEHLRITAQLVDVDTEIHVFSREFELGKEQAEKLIAGLSRMIAAEVGQTLPHDEYHAGLQRLDFAAYRDFVEAVFLHRQGDRESLAGAIVRLKAVVRRYPDFASGHARLAGVYNTYYWTVERVPEYRPLITEHLQAALRLDPLEPYARALDVVGKPHDEVIRVFREVVAADASLVRIRIGLGMRLARAGYLAEASQELDWLRKREPLHPSYNYRQALILLALEDYEKFGVLRQRLLELEEYSQASWLALLLAMAENDASAAATVWPKIEVYDAADTGLTAEHVGEFVNAAAKQDSCHLMEQPLAARIESLSAYWQFVFLSAAPACTEQALAMRFEKIGSLPNFDIPYLLWLPQSAHIRRHPQFIEFVGQFGFPDVWKSLGPPDSCAERDGVIVCH